MRLQRICISKIAPHSRPKIPIEHPVIDRFADMRRGDLMFILKVGDRSGDAEDLVVGAGREAELAVLGSVLRWQ